MCLGGWLLLLFINFCTLFSIIGKGIKFVEFSFLFCVCVLGLNVSCPAIIDAGDLDTSLYTLLHVLDHQ